MHIAISPTQMGRINRNTVLKWIYRWGYSSDYVITQLLNKKATGWAAKTARSMLLKATKTVSGYPRHLYTLSSSGLEAATTLAEMHIDYPELDQVCINPMTIRHDLLTQLYVISLYRSEEILGYWSPREWAVPSQKKLKCPDAVVLLHDGSRIGIELELSGKFGRRLDEFVGDSIYTMSEAAKEHRLDGLWIVSDSPALLERYESAFEIGAPWNTWNKNARGHWVIQDQYFVVKQDVPELDFVHFCSDRI